MDQHIETSAILNVFQKIVDYGEKVEGGSTLEGITASTDIDGYTVFLEGLKVKLTVFFHNTRQTEHNSRSDLDKFYKQLKYINENY